ncbi:MAG TPA: discoidin domain-containing protein [Candidatus Nanoarchaeia archaeon]|nr:discoidin domain-containing protein [Candidatus Nanoarchaeia archaeon]
MHEKKVTIILLLVLALASVSAFAVPGWIKTFLPGLVGHAIADEYICGAYASIIPINASASSVLSASFDASKAIDNDTNTRWIGNATLPYPKWIALDLGAQKCLNAVSLYLFNFSTPLTADVQVSSDAQNWTTVAPGWQVEEERTFVTRSFNETRARYIRLYETAGPATTYGAAGEVRAIAAPLVINPSILRCNDSDAGKNPSIYGEVSIANATTASIYVDACVSEIELDEQYCDNNMAESEVQYCSGGCQQGVCIQSAAGEQLPEMGEEGESAPEESMEEGTGIDGSALGCGTYAFTTPRSATASSQFHNYRAANAIDNNPNSHWFGDPNLGYPKWITLDLGIRRCVNSVDITLFLWDAPMTLDIQTSVDGRTWQTAAKASIAEGGKAERKEFPETVARYIRLYETAGKRSYGTLSEIQVNNAPIEGVPAGVKVQVRNVIGGDTSEVFYEIGGKRAYLEIDGKPVDDYVGQ